MSEQKAFTSERIYWAVEQVEREAGDIADLHLDDNTFYLKSEADKVIAEKDAKILALDAEVFKYKHHAKLFFDERNYAETQLRHQKHRRCLAMAKWCRSRACFYDTMREGSLYFAWKSDRAYEWYKRWLELAEKFKEAK